MKKILVSLAALAVTIMVFFIQGREKEWYSLKVEDDLEVADIDSTDWSYPWYIVKKENGEFSSAVSDMITARDTIHIVRNSRVQNEVQWGKERPIHRIPFATADLDGDTLNLKIYDRSASNWEELNFKVVHNAFKVSYRQDYLMDIRSEGMRIKYAVLELNKPGFSPGDELKGVVMVRIKEDVADRNGDWTIEKVISGDFVVKVQ